MTLYSLFPKFFLLETMWDYLSTLYFSPTISLFPVTCAIASFDRYLDRNLLVIRMIFQNYTQ